MPSEFDYKQYLSLLSKWKYPAIIASLLVMTGAVVLCYLLPKKYEAQSTVFIEKSIISDLLKGIAVSPTVEDKIKVLTYALNSRTLILKVIDDLDLNIRSRGDAQLEEMIRKIQQNVNIKVKGKEGLFIISYLDSDPRLARDYVNALVRRYIEESVSTKREESYGATTFLTDQIKLYKEKLEKADAAVNNARQRVYDAVSRRSRPDAPRSVVRRVDPLQGRLIALEYRLDALRSQFTDNYPEVLKVKSEIETIREQMRSRPRSASTAGSASRRLEREDIEVQYSRKGEFIPMGSFQGQQIPPALQSELEQLERERNYQQSLYEKLISRQGQSEISKQLEVQDKATTFRIIDPAVTPIRPTSPDRVKMILMGILAGLAAGLGIALLLDKMDHSVKSVDSLKKLGVPILAVVPTIRNPQELSLRRKKDIRIFVAASAYFSLIVAVLVYEVLNRYLPTM
jgi:capsular polysaccharide biosynthesis protein